MRKLGFLCAVFLVTAIFFSLLGRFVIPLVSPLWKAENIFTNSVRSSLGFFRTKNSLIAENTALKAQVLSLELERLANPSSSASSALYELLGRPKDDGGITATVITHPPQSPYDFIVVDAGSKDTVIMDSTVRLLQGPEIGKIVEVFPSFSKVKLYSSYGEETHAVLERGEVPVVLLGMGAGNFKLEVPRDTEVEVGDRVVSASLSKELLAVVGRVELKPTDSFKEVLAKSPISIFEVRFVTIAP